MSKKRWVLFGLMMIVLCMPLSACRLAREDSGAAEDADRMIGVLVTKEYLDLFDVEGYLNDNVGKLTDDALIDAEDSREYQGRLYANLVEETGTSEDGETVKHWRYVFDTVEGFAFFAPAITDPETGDAYTNCETGEGIIDGNISLASGDWEEKTDMEGVICITPDSNHEYYFNPVYQSADGRVYATSGQGISGHIGETEGAAFGTTPESAVTVTEEGKSKTVSTSVEIRIQIMFLPEQIKILQFDEEGVLISREEYGPGGLPDTIKPEEDTDYLIVETHKISTVGDPVVTRELYDRTCESFESFYARGDGICLQQWTMLQWN